MFSINNFKITMIQGDTGAFEFSLDNYNLSKGDKVKFSIKETLEDEKVINMIEVTEFLEGKAIFNIDSDFTSIEKFKNPGVYLYDIKVCLKSGAIDTVVKPNKFILLKGVSDSCC